MILHFLCTLLFLTTIGCYSVNEEDVEPENPPNFDVAASSKHEKAFKVTSRRADAPTSREDESHISGPYNGHFSDIDEASPYDDATPLKVVKYKNYGYFNPTLKLSRKAAPLAAAMNAASPAAFQFQSDRNLASLMAHNGNASRTLFHFQRRADEDQFELEEIEDSVNVRDRQVKSNPHVPNHRSFYPTFNDSHVLKLQQTPHHSRRYYHRSANSIEPSSHIVHSETKSPPVLHEDEDIDFESLFNEHYGIKGLSEKKDKVDRPVKVKPADSEREALIGSQREYVDISSESEESNRAASDIDLDREYRKLSFVSTKERSRKVERSLADPEPGAALSSFFIPTPIPGYLYPKSEEVVDNTTIQAEKKDKTSKTEIRGSSTTESVPHSTYFLPTRPAGMSEEVQSITDGLSSFYTVGNASEITSKRPPIVFVTAPVENGPFGPDNIATVEEEISEKKNFTIEDFYNAFSANVTEYPNRHRDEGSSSVVNAATTGSFLAFAPHFPSSPVSDLESSRAIKYPCTCDKGKCGCCTGRIMSNFNVNIPARGCLNITYIPEDFEFLVKMTYNDRTLAQRRVSGKNPRPMCVPLPRLTGRAQACVKLSNVYLVGRNVHMCLDLEAKIQNEELFKVSFDCVRMGTSGIKWIKPEDGGDLPPPPVVEGPAPDDYDAVVASEGDEITDAKEMKKNGVKKMGNITKTADVTKTENLTRVSPKNPVKSVADNKNVPNSLENAKHVVKDEKQKKTGGKQKQGNNKGIEGKRSHKEKEEEEDDDEYDYD